MAKYKLKLKGDFKYHTKNEIRQELFPILQSNDIKKYYIKPDNNKDDDYNVLKVKRKTIIIEAKNKKVIKKIMDFYDQYENYFGEGYLVGNNYKIKKYKK